MIKNSEAQNKLDKATARILIKMYSHHKKVPCKTGLCNSCLTRHNMENLKIPSWYSTRAKVCPECLERLGKRR